VSDDIIDSINRNMDNMRRSERSVANFVLKYPEEVIHMRIVDLASEAHVSEPTVVRFCRAIQCDSFQAFKLQLAQLLAAKPSFNRFNVPVNATTADYCETVFETTTNTLTAVRKALDYSAIEKAVTCLAEARRVEFYGFGASASVAMDAQHKFFRLQIASASYSDPHIQAMSAMSLQEKDVVVAISQSGRTQNLVDALRMASHSGATIITLAPRNTPVTQQADVAIHIDVLQDSEDTYTPLPSRIVHMAVVDVLAVGVSKLKGPTVDEHLRKLSKGLQLLRHN